MHQCQCDARKGAALRPVMPGRMKTFLNDFQHPGSILEEFFKQDEDTILYL